MRQQSNCSQFKHRKGHHNILKLNDNKMSFELLGQWCVLQDCWLDAAPEHCNPPYCGAGLVQDLVRSWVPPPHVTVQVSQLDHDVYPPLTMRNENIILKQNNHLKVQRHWSEIYNNGQRNSRFIIQNHLCLFDYIFIISCDRHCSWNYFSLKNVWFTSWFIPTKIV